MSRNKIFTPNKNKLILPPLEPETNNTENESSKILLKNNNDNIQYKDFSYTLPTTIRTPINTNNNSPYTLETRINELESKLFILEQQNNKLMNKLYNNQNNYEAKIKKLELNSLEEQNNRFKTEKAMALLTEKNNQHSNEIKNKISLLHNSLQKEEEYKNEQRKLDIDLQKNLLNKLTEKLNEIVKTEIDDRLKNDMENKAYNQNIFNKIINDMDILKKEVEDINNQLKNDIKILSKDCSERAHNISKYIDKQILNTVIGKNDTLDNLKKFLDQLISQVKTNINVQSQQNKLFDERLKEIEKHVEKSKNDNFGYMSEVETRFEKKMNNLKNFIEVNTKKHDNFLDDTIKNISMTVDKNFSFLTNQIIETRYIENEEFEKIKNNNNEMFTNVIEDLEKICERVYQYENLLNVYDKQNDLLKKNISDSLSFMKSKLDVHLVNEKILYTIENNLMQEQITALKKKLERSNVELLDNLTKLDSGSKNSIASLILRINEQQNMINHSDTVNNQKFENLNNRTSENEIKQIMSELIFNVENELLNQSLQQSKNSEMILNNIVEDHKKDIENLKQDTSLNIQNTNKLTEKVDQVSIILEASGSNITKIMSDITRIRNDVRENEMTETVAKLMDIMLTNIEYTITSEKMDDMSKLGLEQMGMNIIRLKEQVNNLNESNSTNCSEIGDIKKTIENMNKSGLGDIAKSRKEYELKYAMNQMLNNVEFNNIYSLLNNNNFGTSNLLLNDDLQQKCSDIVENKIKSELEKIKVDNENMWINSVELTQKFNKPEEIKEIIEKVPPVIFPLDYSMKRLLDVDYYNNEVPKAQVNDMNNALLDDKNEENNENNKNEEKKENNENEENKNDNKSEKSNKNDENKGQKLFGKPDNKSVKSNNSKKSKQSANSKNTQNTKNSKQSGNSKNTKNSKKSGDSKNSKNSKQSDKENKSQKSNDKTSKKESEKESEKDKESGTVKADSEKDDKNEDDDKDKENESNENESNEDDEDNEDEGEEDEN